MLLAESNRPSIRIKRRPNDERPALDVRWMHAPLILQKMKKLFPPGLYFTPDLPSATRSNWHPINKLLTIGHHIEVDQQDLSQNWPITNTAELRQHIGLKSLLQSDIRIRCTEFSSSSNGNMRWYYYGIKPQLSFIEQYQYIQLKGHFPTNDEIYKTIKKRTRSSASSAEKGGEDTSQSDGSDNRNRNNRNNRNNSNNSNNRNNRNNKNNKNNKNSKRIRTDRDSNNNVSNMKTSTNINGSLLSSLTDNSISKNGTNGTTNESTNDQSKSMASPAPRFASPPSYSPPPRTLQTFMFQCSCSLPPMNSHNYLEHLNSHERNKKQKNNNITKSSSSTSPIQSDVCIMTTATIQLRTLERLAIAQKQATNKKAGAHSQSMRLTLDLYAVLENRRPTIRSPSTRSVINSKEPEMPVVQISDVLTLREQIRRELLTSLTEEYPDISREFQYNDQWNDALQFFYDTFKTYDTNEKDKDIGKLWRRRIKSDGSLYLGIKDIKEGLKEKVPELFTFFINQVMNKKERNEYKKAVTAQTKKREFKIIKRDSSGSRRTKQKWRKVAENRNINDQKGIMIGFKKQQKNQAMVQAALQRRTKKRSREQRDDPDVSNKKEFSSSSSSSSNTITKTNQTKKSDVKNIEKKSTYVLSGHYLDAWIEEKEERMDRHALIMIELGCAQRMGKSTTQPPTLVVTTALTMLIRGGGASWSSIRCLKNYLCTIPPSACRNMRNEMASKFIEDAPRKLKNYVEVITKGPPDDGPMPEKIARAVYDVHRDNNTLSTFVKPGKGGKVKAILCTHLDNHATKGLNPNIDNTKLGRVKHNLSRLNSIMTVTDIDDGSGTGSKFDSVNYLPDRAPASVSVNFGGLRKLMNDPKLKSPFSKVEGIGPADTPKNYYQNATSLFPALRKQMPNLEMLDVWDYNIRTDPSLRYDFDIVAHIPGHSSRIETWLWAFIKRIYDKLKAAGCDMTNVPDYCEPMDPEFILYNCNLRYLLTNLDNILSKMDNEEKIRLGPTVNDLRMYEGILSSGFFTIPPFHLSQHIQQEVFLDPSSVLNYWSPLLIQLNFRPKAFATISKKIVKELKTYFVTKEGKNWSGPKAHVKAATLRLLERLKAHYITGSEGDDERNDDIESERDDDIESDDPGSDVQVQTISTNSSSSSSSSTTTKQTIDSNNKNENEVDDQENISLIEYAIANVAERQAIADEELNELDPIYLHTKKQIFERLEELENDVSRLSCTKLWLYLSNVEFRWQQIKAPLVIKQQMTDSSIRERYIYVRSQPSGKLCILSADSVRGKDYFGTDMELLDWFNNQSENITKNISNNNNNNNNNTNNRSKSKRIRSQVTTKSKNEQRARLIQNEKNKAVAAAAAATKRIKALEALQQEEEEKERKKNGEIREEEEKIQKEIEEESKANTVAQEAFQRVALSSKVKKCTAACGEKGCNRYCHCRMNTKKARVGLGGPGSSEPCDPGVCGCTNDNCNNQVDSQSRTMRRLKGCLPAAKKLQSLFAMNWLALQECQDKIDAAVVKIGNQLRLTHCSSETPGDEWNLDKCWKEICQMHPGALSCRRFLEVDLRLGADLLYQWDMKGNAYEMHAALPMMAVVVANTQPKICQTILSHISDLLHRTEKRPDLNRMLAANLGKANDVHVEEHNSRARRGCDKAGIGQHGNVVDNHKDITKVTASLYGMTKLIDELNNSTRETRISERRMLYEKFKRQSWAGAMDVVKDFLVDLVVRACQGKMDSTWIPALNLFDRGLPKALAVIDLWEKNAEDRATNQLRRLGAERDAELARYAACEEMKRTISHGNKGDNVINLEEEDDDDGEKITFEE